MDYLNEWIAARNADGFLARAVHAWFEGRIWQTHVQADPPPAHRLRRLVR